ncbi:hypothetical protein MCAP1_001709 [Malassezia caprae]|uniref:Uncharacterized protein n=1 Tax=Malassezia caprae TaxID=1381934 RepID=A0AAF0IV65_9BASI|nr:hypothetical protein MCAP1_001709 [Malassezia caprae]
MAAHSLLLPRNQLMVIPDIDKDWRFRQSPYRNGLKFFISTPLYGSQGEILGSFCMGDVKARPPPDEREKRLFMDLTSMITNSIDLSLSNAQLARRDELKRCVEYFLRHFLHDSEQQDDADQAVVLPTPSHGEGATGGTLSGDYMHVFNFAAETLHVSMDVSGVVIFDLSSFVLTKKPTSIHGKVNEHHVRAIGYMIMDVVAMQSVVLADRAKSSFISNMSHELRTPLHGILASTELLSDTKLDDVQRSYTHTIESCGHGLLELVNHVLDYTKLSSDVNSSSIQQEKHTQYCDVDLQLGGGGIRRVLTNLIGNALKFTDQGYILVSLQHTPISEHKIRASFRVKDTGCGISRSFLDQHLFQPFSQEDPLKGGTGLGLSIVNELRVHASSASVSIMHESSHHILAPMSPISKTLAHSIVELDTAIGDQEGKVEHSSTPPIVKPLNPQSSWNVLFADDNAVNRQVLRAYLKKLNISCSEARDGSEAILQFSSQPSGHFSLILMDYSMPNIDGLSATLAIRQLEQQRLAIEGPTEERAPPRAAIYMLSGTSTGEILRQAYAAGADGYLSKPLSFKVFVSLLKSIGLQ